VDTWTYYVEKITPSIQGSLEFRLSDVNKTLNEDGREGWELVALVQTQPGVLLAFFKKKLVI
jgi:hypothetical protein